MHARVLSLSRVARCEGASAAASMGLRAEDEEPGPAARAKPSPAATFTMAPVGPTHDRDDAPLRTHSCFRPAAL